ncbi:DUF455 family protein [Thalassoroseus pseudoceratinae]|uniref:DUF455 family protein n=1 Tax=Thalassoroseus pseudoceratinae TaxID=2713176 RepID=UPI0014220EFE|nr:DUF455 family protein [Thalassoroseus pseudoceratinae]
MELRHFAERILKSASLEKKLAVPDSPLSDREPGEPWFPTEPVRPANLQFAPARTAPKMPHPNTLRDPQRRGVAHHIMANHELQACEVMARTLVAFPHAPTEFRMGLAKVVQDEQRHTRMHARHAERCGVEFGSLPVNCYIWKKSLEFSSVLDYLAGIPLTFEGANLDHSLEWKTAFDVAGDKKSAACMQVIHDDEIEHVRFGMEWLRQLKTDDQTEWTAFEEHLNWPLRPEKSVGNHFNSAPRLAAGMSAEFIELLRHAWETAEPIGSNTNRPNRQSSDKEAQSNTESK